MPDFFLNLVVLPVQKPERIKIENVELAQDMPYTGICRLKRRRLAADQVLYDIMHERRFLGSVSVFFSWHYKELSAVGNMLKIALLCYCVNDTATKIV